METPYLVLREDGAALVKGIAKQGVTVRFLTNSLGSTDAFYTVARLWGNLDQLRVPNVQVWAYEGAPLPGATRTPASKRWGVHAKRAVFDDNTVVVGTYNIDPRSANLNSELIVICRGNTALAADMQQNMQQRLTQSRPILGTSNAGGEVGLIEGASEDEVFKMKAVAPIASFLDFLM